MKLIVGLGNPEEKYKLNRHNIGFILLERLAGEFGLSFRKSPKASGLVAMGDGFVLLKPLTYMNRSGNAVSKALSFFKLDPKNLVVVHDDVDLKFGEIKSKVGQSPAGHHGVEDIIEKLGTKEFQRVRVGVGRPTHREEVESYVLSDFTNEELKHLEEISLSKFLFNLRLT